MLLIATNKLVAIMIPILASVMITVILAIQRNKKDDRDN